MSLLKLERDLELGAEGVYRIYLRASPDDEVTLYIGQSGDLRNRWREYDRCTKFFRTDGKALDTIGVVHTMLLFLKAKGLDCYFEQESDDPDDEDALHQTLVPTLQRLDGPVYLQRHYSLPKTGPERWTKSSDDRAKAQARLFEIFEAEQWPLIQWLCPILRNEH